MQPASCGQQDTAQIVAQQHSSTVCTLRWRSTGCVCNANQPMEHEPHEGCSTRAVMASLENAPASYADTYIDHSSLAAISLDVRSQQPVISNLSLRPACNRRPRRAPHLMSAIARTLSNILLSSSQLPRSVVQGLSGTSGQSTGNQLTFAAAAAVLHLHRSLKCSCPTTPVTSNPPSTPKR